MASRVARVEIGYSGKGSDAVWGAVCRNHGQAQGASTLYDPERWRATIRRQVLGSTVQKGGHISVYIGSRLLTLAVLALETEETDVSDGPGLVSTGTIGADTRIEYVERHIDDSRPGGGVPGYGDVASDLAREIRGYFESRELYQELRTRAPQSICLQGVRGVGKSTVLSHALGRLPYAVVRGDLEEIAVNASGTEMADEYIAAALKDLADRARAAAPAVIVLDNLSVLANVAAGYVARDIGALCRQAFLKALRQPASDAASSDADALVSSLQNLSLTRAEEAPSARLPEWSHFAAAFRIARPSQQLGFESVRPTKRWSDIGGYDDVKQKLQQFIRLATSETSSRLGVRPPAGILLHGASGLGKTAMALAMIGESACNVISIRGSELYSKYLGETEARLRRLFQAARAAAPCVVFMDEVDSLAAKREWSSMESGGPALRVLSTLLNEMDGVHETRGVVAVGCTNQLDRIDDAIVRPGRFDQLVEIRPPTAADRRGILQVLARRSRLAADVDLDQLGQATAGYSAARLEMLFREAGLAALRSSCDAAALAMRDFTSALKTMYVAPAAEAPPV
ncbi:hypothetical protein GGF46_004446 [Coemansia sp. RSA 552]|nr:hypothetical protein GGF46_004446 [Coemansia sp. RSA 552]